MDKPIFNIDLIKNPKTYSVDILKKNMRNLSKKIVLSTQVLDASFCVSHILNVPIDSGDEDSYIFEEDVLEFQPHITEEELTMAKQILSIS
jgi:hypothetical protein